MDKHFTTADTAEVNGVPHTNGVKDHVRADSKEDTAYEAARLTKQTESELKNGESEVNKEQSEAPNVDGSAPPYRTK